MWSVNIWLIKRKYIRDQPFNLGGGGYGFLFRSENNLFCRAEREFFFAEFNIRLYDKNSESVYIFFPPPKSEYFFRKKYITVSWSLIMVLWKAKFH
jgi:hypothetical protein